MSWLACGSHVQIASRSHGGGTLQSAQLRDCADALLEEVHGVLASAPDPEHVRSFVSALWLVLWKERKSKPTAMHRTATGRTNTLFAATSGVDLEIAALEPGVLRPQIAMLPVCVPA